MIQDDRLEGLAVNFCMSHMERFDASFFICDEDVTIYNAWRKVMVGNESQHTHDQKDQPKEQTR